MNKNIETLIYCLIAGFLGLFLINLISFFFELFQNGIGESWNFRFKHATFSLTRSPLELSSVAQEQIELCLCSSLSLSIETSVMAIYLLGKNQNKL